MSARELYDAHHAALVPEAGGTLPFVSWDALTPREQAGWEYAASLMPSDTPRADRERLSLFPAVDRILADRAASTVRHVVHVTAEPVAEDVVWCDECEEWVTSGAERQTTVQADDGLRAAVTRQTNAGLDDFRMGRASNDDLTQRMLDAIAPYLSDAALRAHQLADNWQAEVEDDGPGMTSLEDVLTELRAALAPTAPEDGGR